MCDQGRRRWPSKKYGGQRRQRRQCPLQACGTLLPACVRVTCPYVCATFQRAGRNDYRGAAPTCDKRLTVFPFLQGPE